MKVKLLVVLLVCCSWVQCLSANNLGVVGETYEIIEEDFVEMVKRIIQNKINNGDFERWKKELQGKVKATANRPKGALLPKAQVYRVIEFDPSVTLDYDIPDANGKILFAKGTKVNPLDVRSWTKTWCFFDGDDEEQTEWVRSYCSDKLTTKWILVSGSPNELMKKYKRRVFFDQAGELRGKFKFQSLPATVRQGEGQKVLHVEEFVVN